MIFIAGAMIHAIALILFLLILFAKKIIDHHMGCKRRGRMIKYFYGQ